MVRGLAIAVTAVDPINQCADTTRMPRGLPITVPMRFQALVKPLSSNVFIGLPWPINKAGIRCVLVSFMLRASLSIGKTVDLSSQECPAVIHDGLSCNRALMLVYHRSTWLSTWVP